MNHVPTAEAPTATPDELAQLVMAGARALDRRIDMIDDPDTAGSILAIVDGIVTAAQEIHGVALHIAHTDDESATEEPEPLTGAWLELTEDRTYGITPTGGAA